MTRPISGPIRILVDQAVHDHRNKGNNALSEVALDRLGAFWPGATFEALSVSPHFCRVFLRGAQPVSPYDLRPLRTRLDPLHRFVPAAAWLLLFELREMLPVRSAGRPAASAAAEAEVEVDARAQAEETAVADGAAAEKERLRRAMAAYDLYAATGGGYLCDTDKRFLLPMLDRLEAAVDVGVPAVMVGQGVGPMSDPELLARCAQVLPRIDYLMIREERAARPLLESMGVPREKTLMTGDDALELAYRLRGSGPGAGIGLSLRVNATTAVGDQQVAAIRPVVQRAAERHAAPVIAAPISYYRHEADIVPIAALMRGARRNGSSWRRFEALPSFIRRIGRCRVMISGTFHAAAFALGQGIPAIVLARSVEYHDKLAGLAEQFGAPGGQVIHLNDPQLGGRLEEAIETAWAAAPDIRPRLLADSERQIALGQAAYRRIAALVEARRAEKAGV
jgi:polysaccharide pyruvyl transferase WcaK-like protein